MNKILWKALYAIALLFTIIGFTVAYHYGGCDEKYSSITGCGTVSGDMGHAVGGDAYNYIIMSGRGTAWMVAGLTAAVTGTGFLIVSKLEESHAAKRDAA